MLCHVIFCSHAGLERDKFDNKTVSFEEHIKNEHNMWHYLYFLVLVRVKDPTEYTGPESYVAQMIKVSLPPADFLHHTCFGSVHLINIFTADQIEVSKDTRDYCGWNHLEIIKLVLDCNFYLSLYREQLKT